LYIIKKTWIPRIILLNQEEGILLILSNNLKEIIFKLEVIITKIIEEKFMKQHILIEGMFVMLHLN